MLTIKNAELTKSLEDKSSKIAELELKARDLQEHSKQQAKLIAYLKQKNAESKEALEVCFII